MKNYLQPYIVLCISTLLIVAMLQFSACDKDEHIMLRIENQSSYDFDAVELQWEKSFYYSNIPVGEQSDYQEVESAYRYSYVKLTIDKDEFVIQPIDYVGEQKLEPGSYTYILKIVDYNTRSLSLTLKED